ncbi:cytochrome P450 family protein [Yinghuangia sp. YIM S10712]|uniref:cytochrome P450 family protein n=1 Tax=Yinghuangia sp. YIM S10712 TaxID=3436930 RepID=UPI003F52D2D1
MTAPGSVSADDLDMLSWGFAQDPHGGYAAIREHGGVRRRVVKTLATELHAWVVTGYDDARALLADQRLSKDVELLRDIMQARAVRSGEPPARTPRTMLFSDPPDHTRLRRLVGHAFTARRVETLRPWIEKSTDDILDTVEPGVPFDLVERLAMALPIYVIGELLGVPQERHGDFRAWSTALAGLDTTAEAKQAATRQAFTYLTELVGVKRDQPGDDMLSALIQAREEDGTRLDQPELLSMVFLLMNAGYETTASLIGSGTYTLLRAPDQLRLLRDNPGLVPGAVEELLRYESPLNLSTLRCTTAPVTLGDVTIPEGEIVFIALLAANRDSARFPDADRLDVTRPAQGHLSFGHGIHHCIGAPLARLEGEIVFGKLLERFPHWELAVPEDELVWKFSAQFRALERLPVRMS